MKRLPRSINPIGSPQSAWLIDFFVDDYRLSAFDPGALALLLAHAVE
jgi:hypothetical protein